MTVQIGGGHPKEWQQPSDPIAARLAEVARRALNAMLDAGLGTEQGAEAAFKVYQDTIVAALREQEALRRENERLRELLRQAPVMPPVNAYPNDWFGRRAVELDE